MTRPAERGASARTLVQWLRTRTDEQLVDLLRRRPDLGLPAPADLTTLASRIGVRTSVQRAVDSLDAWRLRVLEALVLSVDADEGPVVERAVELLGGDARALPIRVAMNDLTELALTWGPPTAPQLTPFVVEALGPYPAALGRPAINLLRNSSDLVLAPVLRSLGEAPASQPRSGSTIAALLADPDHIAKLLAATDPDERAVLERLDAGPPVGLVRDAQQGLEDDDAPAPKRLIARGLLVAIDAQSVELPREVGLALRGAAALAAVEPEPPTIEALDRTPAEADRSGATAVLELLRLVESLANDWTQHPPAMLRTGGVGVREMRRTIRTLGIDEPMGAMVIELAAAAGLIAATNGITPTYLPTPEFDTWVRREPAERWATLAVAWLGMTRQPSLIGQRDERERLITVLGPDAERSTVANLRRTVLGLVASIAPGATPRSRDAVLARLAWESPRRATAQRKLADAILTEADQVGLTAAGGLTGYGRAVLSDALTAAINALTIALPEPVDHFVVQPDLTIVVPGPPTPAVGRELALVADLESVGGASVYRVTEASIRRALDAGASATRLTAMLGERSRTPLPQALTYLIDDAARRHGILRTAAAAAYLRCDDEALLARVLSERAVRELDLRLIAPTVAISSAPVTKILDILRNAGFAPAAEAPDGMVVSIAEEAPRAPIRSSSRLARLRPVADLDIHAIDLVRRIRAGDLTSEHERSSAIERARTAITGWEPGQPVPGVTSATTLGVLRGAIRAGVRIELGYVDSEGRTTHHWLLPISMAGGTLRGHDPVSKRLEAYQLHRITDVIVHDDDDDELDDDPF